MPRFLPLTITVVLTLVAPVALAAPTPRLPWQWSSVPDHYPRVDLTARIRHSAYVLTELPSSRPGSLRLTVAELRRELRKGGVRQVLWRARIRAPQGLPSAAMVVSGTRVFVARHSRIATTCTLYAFSTVTGRRLWKKTLRGIGPIGHSKWFNRVQLRVQGGHPIVYGHEGPGTSYVEQRDAATGGLRSHRKVRMARPPTPLAERLFGEVHRVLRGATVYRRTVADFIRGHVLRIQSPGVALQRFRRAVSQIDGLRAAGGRYTVRARLLRQPSGAHVIEARRR